jgi:hypothetical protein
MDLHFSAWQKRKSEPFVDLCFTYLGFISIKVNTGISIVQPFKSKDGIGCGHRYQKSPK